MPFADRLKSKIPVDPMDVEIPQEQKRLIKHNRYAPHQIPAAETRQDDFPQDQLDLKNKEGRQKNQHLQ